MTALELAPDPLDVPPAPGSGCPYGDSFPGWRIVVEAYFTPAPGRTYGAGTYGSLYYGDPTGNDPGRLFGQGLYGDGYYGSPGTDPRSWVDITTPAFEVDITAGTEDGAPTVPVTEFTITAHDDDGDYWDYASPARYNLPWVNDQIRVGLLDPGGTYWPLAHGAVYSITDEHDTKPRFVEIVAYGIVSTYVTNRQGWQRPREYGDSRINELIRMGGYEPSYERPTGLAWPVTADPAARDIVLRDEIDRTAYSIGWFFDQKPSGHFRFRPWPHEPAGTAVVVTDCHEADNAAAFVAPITFAADTEALLNDAQVTNNRTPPHAIRYTDASSVTLYDHRTNALGFPRSDLAFDDGGFGTNLAVRAVNRFAYAITRVPAVDLDTLRDARWLAVAASIDTGRPVTVDRRHPAVLRLDCVVVGYTHRLTRNRMETTLNLETLTPTY